MFKSKMLYVLIFCLALFYGASSSAAQPRHKTIDVGTLKDKLAGAWIGQLIGNIYGLPHENKYIENPGPENWPYSYTRSLEKLKRYDGAFSDDDTDIEYMYLLQMEQLGTEPSYAQLRKAWMHHVRDRVWLANRASLGLMHHGFSPPFTGRKELNPHWFQIDPQLINEIWAYTAPGMVKYAAAKSYWAACITSDEWGTEPTVHYGAMYAAAFFENDIRKLIQIGLNELPANSRYAQTVREMISLHQQYPNQWQKARQIMAEKYYVNEPDLTKTIWNANLNGACAILALLYGNGDFQHTLDLACAMGFDADNQAATLAGLLGIINGFEKLPSGLYLPLDHWNEPFNNKYINITRHDLPDATLTEILDKLYNITIKLILSKGGKIEGKPGKEKIRIPVNASFDPPLELSDGPMPALEVGQAVDHAFYTKFNQHHRWMLIDGLLPPGLSFDNGKLIGTPTESGTFNIKIQIDNNKNITLEKSISLIVRGHNIARLADSVIANVSKMNQAVLDSCWYTFGRSMYATDADVIRDGKTNGPGSVFYSLAAKANIPKVDYYGYQWKTPQEVSMMAFHTGGMEEFGGWFTSLNVQYLNEKGKWQPVESIVIEPMLPESDLVFYQPHFVEYVIRFKPVITTAIRIIGDAKVQDHWHKYTKKVSAFTSITELKVYAK